MDVLWTCLVIVLGYPSRPDGSLHPLQEERVNHAVNVFREYQCDRLLFTGGAVGRSRSESKVMAEEAIRMGVSSEKIILEEKSRSTFENILFTKSYWERSAQIIIASERSHASRARAYLRRLNPEKANVTKAIGYWPNRAILFWVPLYSFFYNAAASVRDIVSPPQE